MPEGNSRGPDLPVFQTVREFNAPCDVVWAAWTERRRLERWFGPRGTQATSIRFEMKPGGVVHTKLETPQGAIYARWDILEVEPLKKLAYLHAVADEVGALAKLPWEGRFPTQMMTTVLFHALGEKTRVTLSWMPHEATAAEIEFFRSAMSGMQQGWAGSFEQLDAYLAE